MLAGDLGQWLAHFMSLEERLVASVETVWPVCIAPLQAAKGTMTHEDYITNHLVTALIRSKSLPGRIVPQYALLAPNAQKLIQVGSKIDFVLTIGDDEAIYLACECKRLNATIMMAMIAAVWCVAIVFALLVLLLATINRLRSDHKRHQD